MNLLILDTETTSTAEDAEVCEVAAVLFSVEYMTILQSFSTLVPVSGMPDEAFHVHGISREATKEICKDCRISDYLQLLGWESDYYLAHFKEFDKNIITRNQFPVPPDGLGTDDGDDIPWICTATELTFPKQQRPGQSLVSLCVAHGVPIVSAHRALDDCLLIAKLLQVAFTPETLKAAIEDALIPRFEYQALTSYANRHLPKDAGFRWDGDRKMWLAKLKESQLESLGFAVTRTDSVIPNGEDA